MISSHTITSLSVPYLDENRCNSDSGYSKSLQTVFKTSFLSGGGDVIDEVNLVDSGFNAEDAVKSAIDNKAEAIVLVSNSEAFPQALEVIKANKRKLPLLGGDSPYGSALLEKGGADAEGMVLAVPWHILADPGAVFPKSARQLWGGDMNWRTALTYDATQALIAGLEKDSSFEAKGASGTIRFLSSGDRNRATHLAKVSPDANAEHGFNFVPIR
ncbi:MAG: receptor ligand binding family protein [Chloroflexi bacterium AL-N5]|nr:receptor ligand binding family protein [Chloroflexi bacterium AL-N5]